MLAQEINSIDAAWFEAHPNRTIRVRELINGETTDGSKITTSTPFNLVSIKEGAIQRKLTGNLATVWANGKPDLDAGSFNPVDCDEDSAQLLWLVTTELERSGDDFIPMSLFQEWLKEEL